MTVDLGTSKLDVWLVSEPVASEIIEAKCLGHVSTVSVHLECLVCLVPFLCRSLTTSVQGVFAKSTPFWLELLFSPNRFPDNIWWFSNARAFHHDEGVCQCYQISCGAHVRLGGLRRLIVGCVLTFFLWTVFSNLRFRPFRYFDVEAAAHRGNV